MSRLVLVIVLAVVVTALAAGSVLSSASTGVGQATVAAKKCKKSYVLKKGKCVKKKATAVTLKDGDYTYKQATVGSAPVNTLTISGKGTKVHIRELFFSSGVDPADNVCAATMIDFGTYTLKREGDFLVWIAPAKPVTVPPIQELGAGGGAAKTHGEINVKTLVVNVATDVVMKNRAGGSGCYEGHTYEGVQKLKRK